MNFKHLLAAATLLFSVAGVSNAQVDLPTEGTTEWNVSGNISFDDDTGWFAQGLWAPFISDNLQWGVAASIQDSGFMDVSGTIGGLVNWYFRGDDATGSTTLPYVGLGLGFGWGDIDGSVWNVHAGIKQFISSDVAIFGELGWYNYSEDAIDDDAQINFGISVFR